MSNHPIIKALQDELAKDAKRLSLANNPMSFHLNCQTQSQAIENYIMGHEAASARLLPIISEAVEIMYQIGLARCPSYMAHPQSVWFDEHVQSKAREFLSTLADAGVIKKEVADE